MSASGRGVVATSRRGGWGGGARYRTRDVKTLSLSEAGVLASVREARSQREHVSRVVVLTLTDSRVACEILAQHESLSTGYNRHTQTARSVLRVIETPREVGFVIFALENLQDTKMGIIEVAADPASLYSACDMLDDMQVSSHVIMWRLRDGARPNAQFRISEKRIFFIYAWAARLIARVFAQILAFSYALLRVGIRRDGHRAACRYAYRAFSTRGENLVSSRSAEAVPLSAVCDTIAPPQRARYVRTLTLFWAHDNWSVISTRRPQFSWML